MTAVGQRRRGAHLDDTRSSARCEADARATTSAPCRPCRHWPAELAGHPRLRVPSEWRSPRGHARASARAQRAKRGRLADRERWPAAADAAAARMVSGCQWQPGLADARAWKCTVAPAARRACFQSNLCTMHICVHLVHAVYEVRLVLFSPYLRLGAWRGCGTCGIFHRPASGKALTTSGPGGGGRMGITGSTAALVGGSEAGPAWLLSASSSLLPYAWRASMQVWCRCTRASALKGTQMNALFTTTTSVSSSCTRHRRPWRHGARRSLENVRRSRKDSERSRRVLQFGAKVTSSVPTRSVADPLDPVAFQPAFRS